MKQVFFLPINFFFLGCCCFILFLFSFPISALTLPALPILKAEVG